MICVGLLLQQTIRQGQIRCNVPDLLCVYVVAKAGGQLQAAQRGAAHTQ